MASLTSSSTDAQVAAAYDDNASYEEDNSPTKAAAFLTACRILKRRVPQSMSSSPGSVTERDLDADIEAVQDWLKANGSTQSMFTRGRCI